MCPYWLQGEAEARHALLEAKLLGKGLFGVSAFALWVPNQEIAIPVLYMLHQ